MFPSSGRQCPGEHVMLAEIREREPKGKTWRGWRVARALLPLKLLEVVTVLIRVPPHERLHLLKLSLVVTLSLNP